MNTGTSLSERISRFLKPATQAENENRQEQIRNTVLFVVGTGLIVYFRKSIAENFLKITDSA